MQILDNVAIKLYSIKWRQRIGEFQILICVAFFGLSFTIQRMAAVNPDKATLIGPITYNAMRYLISTIILAFVLPILKRIEDKESSKEKDSDDETEDLEKGEGGLSSKENIDPHTAWYYAWYYGSICGFTGFVGSSLQQIGLMHTSIAKTAFITALFVIVVPFIESFLPGGRMTHSTWMAAIMSMLGTFYISGLAEASERGSMSETGGVSELIIFVSMLFWTVAIMATDRGCKKCDGVLLTAIDFLCVTVCSIIAGVIFEPEEWMYPFDHIRSNMYYIVGVGITETVANADDVAQWPTMCPPRIEKTYMYRTDRPNSRGRTYFFNSGQILSWGDFSSLTWVDDAWVAAWLARATHTFDLESSHAPLSVV